MPLLKIQTNINLSADPIGIMRRVSATVAEMLGKPERYVMVSLETGQSMLFAGDNQPLAYLELKSIGLPEDRTTEFSAALCGVIQEQLSIPPERVYIEFSSAQRTMWGWNNRTF